MNTMFFYELWEKFQKKFNKFERILVYIITSLILIILLVTIIGFASKKARPGKYLRKADPSPLEIRHLSKKAGEEMSAFSGIGSLRILTASENEEETGTILVVTPWFTYPAGETAFFEELSRKNRLIENTITSYFSSHTRKELLYSGEEQVKEELKHKINDQLTLGKILDLYFTDYIFIE
ncbi:MAG: flagellar basal body-associated FliL family protein [Treponema sp.]|nr:flagellar basal body-associated FliL family protein [Treponema sp.]